ncbi:hypothetical protein ANN_22447, partial [Periplaneta americana]
MNNSCSIYFTSQYYNVPGLSKKLLISFFLVQVNTFQVVVISDGSDSFVEFLYADNGIQWIQGMAQSSGLPDARAQAGFVSGDGRLYTLRGSGTDQIQNLDKWSNVGVDGVWVFHIGHTGSAGNVMPPDLEVGSESSTTDSCSIGATTCHSKANCVDYQSGGFCCVCQRGYYGNGLNCLKEDIPLRVNGKITGSLNGHDLSQLDLQSYVVTSDGRTYTALSHVSTDIGYDMQPLSLLGGVIGWLFARPVSKAVNGYELTGGVFNHTADITFPQSGHKVTIRQHYYGLDVFDQLRMDTEIRGTLPTIAIGKRIQIADYEEQYTSTSPGLILSQSSLKFQLDGTPVDNPFNIEQVIRYNECQFSPKNISTFRLKVTRNFISYEAHEKIIRYAMTNKVTPLGDEDPCRTGRSKCGEHSSCLVEGDTFRCVCNPGYQYLYGDNEDEESAVCVDINECSAGTHTCDFNAICVNEPGSFACQCKTGYTGDGSHCDKLPSCEDLGCHPDAECIERYPGNLQCRCLPGYTGDGLHCVPLSSRESCDTANDCSPYGACIFSDIVNNYICVCVPGYSGDGYSCYESPTHNETDDGDLPIPSCYFGTCDCPSGYDVQGQICVPKEDISNESTNENEGNHFNSRFTMKSSVAAFRLATDHDCLAKHLHRIGIYQFPNCPLCNSNQEMDSKHLKSCASVADHGNIFEKYWSARGQMTLFRLLSSQVKQVKSMEKITTIAEKTEVVSYKVAEIIASKMHLHTLILPAYKEIVISIIEETAERDIRNDILCISFSVSCNIVNRCHPHAQCVFISSLGQYQCQCNAGYEGDGYECEEIDISCLQADVCDPHATCTYNEARGKAICICNPGYQGDGMLCTQAGECSSPEDCGSNARCVWSSIHDQYECICDPGYSREGPVCVLLKGLTNCKKHIPRGKPKKYTPFWTENLNLLKQDRDKARTEAEHSKTPEDTQDWRKKTAILKKAIITAKKNIWKKAIIVPIHKKGKPAHDVNSYRPIALLSKIAKTMESMIFNRLTWYLESQNLLSPRQAGFRQLHSTNEQVICLGQEIKDSFNKKKDTLAIFIDFQLAYDSVWRNKLLLKLQKLGISSNMFRWISEFLSQRFIATKFNNSLSSYRQTYRGLSQGPVLSTTLFNIYINDLPSLLEESNMKTALFADDIVFWTSGSYRHRDKIQNSALKALNQLHEWNTSNLMTLNLSKSNYQIFSLGKKER